MNLSWSILLEIRTLCPNTEITGNEPMFITPNQRETAATSGEIRTEPFAAHTAGRGQRVVLAETGAECRLVGETTQGVPVFYYADSDYSFDEAVAWLDATH